LGASPRSRSSVCFLLGGQISRSSRTSATRSARRARGRWRHGRRTLPATRPARPTRPAGDVDGKGDPSSIRGATELLIIRTGELTIEVGDLDAAVAQARARVVAAGGFVSGSDRTAEGETAAASASFRIPADRWDDALAAVQALATATRTSTSRRRRSRTR
jgi:hypothetical protein